MNIEHRGNQGIELRATEGKDLPMIVGMPIVFNRLSVPMPDFRGGTFRERVLPSFGERLRSGTDLRALVDHDGGKVLGRQSSGTLRVQVRDNGIAVEIDPPNTSAGRDIVESVRRGDIDGMSFGFSGAEDEWAEEDGETVRSLLSGETLEVSVVAFPAYPDTTVAMRSLQTIVAEIEQADAEWIRRKRMELDLLALELDI